MMGMFCLLTAYAWGLASNLTFESMCFDLPIAVKLRQEEKLHEDIMILEFQLTGRLSGGYSYSDVGVIKTFQIRWQKSGCHDT